MATKQKNAKDSEHAKHLDPSPTRHKHGVAAHEYASAMKVRVSKDYSNSKWDVGMMGGVLARRLGYDCPMLEGYVD